MAPAGLKTRGPRLGSCKPILASLSSESFPCRARIMAEDFVPAVYTFERFLRSLLNGLHRCRKAV